MNPSRAENIDAARTMQFAVFLEQEFKTLTQVQAGLEHTQFMAEQYEYPMLGELRDVLTYIEKALNTLTFVLVFANYLAEGEC